MTICRATMATYRVISRPVAWHAYYYLKSGNLDVCFSLLGYIEATGVIFTCATVWQIFSPTLKQKDVIL